MTIEGIGGITLTASHSCYGLWEKLNSKYRKIEVQTCDLRKCNKRIKETMRRSTLSLGLLELMRWRYRKYIHVAQVSFKLRSQTLQDMFYNFLFSSVTKFVTQRNLHKSMQRYPVLFKTDGIDLLQVQT